MLTENEQEQFGFGRKDRPASNLADSARFAMIDLVRLHVIGKNQTQ